MRRFAIGGALGLRTVDDLCVRLAALRAGRVSPGVQFDFSNLRKIEPSATALLIATLRKACNEGVCDPLVRYQPPRDGAVPVLAAPELARLVSNSRVRNRFVTAASGCEAFIDGAGIDAAIAALQAHLATRVAVDARTLTTVGTLLSELTENVLQHAGHGGGVAAVGPCSPDSFEIAVADCGIGVRRSLARNPDYSDVDDDVTALRMAVRAQATGEPGSAGGMGLFLARLAVAESGNTLVVRSGSARVTQGDKLESAGSLPHLGGTLVAVRARSDRTLDYDIVDRLLESARGARSDGE